MRLIRTEIEILSAEDVLAAQRGVCLKTKLNVPQKFLFVDEMSSNLGFTRLDGRAVSGQRVVEDVSSQQGENVSTLGVRSPLDE